MEQLENIPAIIYSAFWSTREMGFMKRILKELKIDKLTILVFSSDYLPGALIQFDGVKGDFYIESVYNLENVDYDGAFIGKMQLVIDLLHGHYLSKGLWYLITGRIKLKGIGALIKFLKIIGRSAL